MDALLGGQEWDVARVPLLEVRARLARLPEADRARVPEVGCERLASKVWGLGCWFAQAVQLSE